MKILLIDDNQNATSMMATYLKTLSENYSVEVANNGFQALDIFMKFKPNVTILDITMPNIDGFEVLTRIFQMDKTANVIMATASDSQQNIELCIKKGARGYITKPYSPDELVALIKNVLKGDTTNKDLITFFSRVVSRMNITIHKFIGNDVKISLEDVQSIPYQLKTHTPEIISSIKKVPEIPEKNKIDLSNEFIGFTTEVTGQIEGIIVSAINENDLHFLLNVQNDATVVLQDLFLEFFNVININLLSQLSDSMNVKLNASPTRAYIKDKDNKIEGKDLIKTKFSILLKEKTTELEIYLYLNIRQLFKTS